MRRIEHWFAAFLQEPDLCGLMYIGEPPAPVLRRFHRKMLRSKREKFCSRLAGMSTELSCELVEILRW